MCTWTLGRHGIEGQLSSVGSDTERRDRIHQLAGYLTSPRVVSEPGRYRDCAYIVVEAHGTVDGAPVRFWTHIAHRPVDVEEGARS